MLLKVKKEYVKKIDLIIAGMTKQRSLKDLDTLMSRIIWNYFTNNNKERNRSKKLIDIYMKSNNLDLNDVINTGK